MGRGTTRATTRAAVVLGLALGLLPGGGPVGTAAQAGPHGAIQDLLDRRAEALLAGDRAAFLDTVDRTNRGFVRRQRLLFDGFDRLGLEAYRLRIQDEYADDLATEREVRRYGSSAGPVVLHVEERHRLAGFDRVPAVADLFMTFVRRADGWRVASDTDLEDVALLSDRKLWEAGPILTRDGQHVRVVAHPGLIGAAEGVLADAEEALGRVDRTWPLAWHRRVLILVPTDRAELRRLLQAPFDLDHFVAFATSAVDRREGWRLTGHRIVLNWETFSRYPAALRQRILAHELLHIATRELAGPHVPAFLDEAVAEWAAGEAPTGILEGRVRGGAFRGTFPENHEFLTGGGEDIVAAYQQAASVARYADERWGAQALAAFYRAAGRVRLAPGTWRYHVARASERAFGVGYRELQRGWAAWARETYG